MTLAEFFDEGDAIIPAPAEQQAEVVKQEEIKKEEDVLKEKEFEEPDLPSLTHKSSKKRKITDIEIEEQIG